jgi:hypothetical protein
LDYLCAAPRLRLALLRRALACEEGCDVDISCVSKVCAADADPFCCNAAEGGFWDEFCIAKVNQLCSIDGKPDACTP